MVAAPARLVGAVATLVLIAAVVPFGWPGTAGQTPVGLVATSPPAGDVKYYIVGPPKGGQREYLFEIAVKALGNGKRYPEIVALNQGRLQPDGGRLDDPTMLRTGWILILPNDATGPDVHVGPLPTMQAAPAPTTATATPNPSAEPFASSTVVPEWRDTGLRVGTLLVAVALMALALRALRGGMARPGRRGAQLPVVVTAPAAPVGATRIAIPPPSRTDPAPAEVRIPRTAESAPVELLPTVEPPPTAPQPPYEVQVQHVDDIVRVRLTGANEGTAYVWLTPQDEPPRDSMAIYVGGSSAGSLYLRLTAGPAVVSIIGEPGARRRLARAIAEQLAAADQVVIEVGDAGWPAPPLGAQAVGRLDAMDAALWDRADVVIYHAESGDLAALLASRKDSGRRILILVGDLPPATWSLDVRLIA